MTIRFSKLIQVLFWIGVYLTNVQLTECVVPISSYTQNFEINGRLSTKNTLLTTCTENDLFGEFQVGLYTMSQTCRPPTFTMKYEEVGRVPKATLFFQNRNCLVTDADQYSAAQQQIATANQAVQNFTAAVNDINAQGNRATQGLNIGHIVANAIGHSPLGLIPGIGLLTAEYVDQDQDNQIDSLNSQMYDLRYTTIPQILKDESAINATVNSLAVQLNITNNEIIVLNSSISTLTNLAQQSAAAINSTNQALANASLAVQGQFNVTNQNILALQQSFNQQFNQTQAIFRDNLLALSYIQGNQTLLLSNEIDTLTRNVVSINQNFDALTRIFTRNLRQTRQNRQATLSYFRSSATVPNGYLPFTLGQGIRPYGQLLGADKRILMEQFNINWVTQVTGSGSSATYQIVNSQVRFYTDALWSVDNIQFTTSIDQWINAFYGDETCVRAFTDYDDVQEQFTNSSNPCLVWAEVRSYFCTSNVFPQFQWQYATSVSIDPSYCLSTPSLDPRYPGPLVLKSFGDLTQAFQTLYCSNNTFVVSLERAQQAYIIPQNLTLCPMTWKNQRFQAESLASSQSFFYQIFGRFALSTTIAYSDTYDRELKLFGRNPGGLQYVNVPQSYTPSYYNGTVPVYDNALAQPIDCVEQNWMAASTDTVPMISITPSAALPVQKSILISIDGPQCTDPTQCYPVGDNDVTQNINLDVSAVATLPGAFLTLGFMEDFTQGIWDVPQRSISASLITSERENTVGYLMMPPGTQSTFTMPEWIARNTDLFDPTVSVPAEYYRFPALFDDTNSPYCGVASGQPVNSYQTSTYGCVVPFVGQTSPNLTSFDANLPSQCLIKQSATVLLNDYQTQLNGAPYQTYQSGAGLNQIPSIIAGSQNYSLTFQYQHDSVLGNFQPVSVYTVLSPSVNNFISFLVNQNGLPIVQMQGFDSSSSTNSIIDLRDGLWHNIVYNVVPQSGSIYFEVFADGIIVCSVTQSVSVFASKTDLVVLQPYQQTYPSNDAQVRSVSLIASLGRPLTENEVSVYWMCSEYDSSSLQCAAQQYSMQLAFQNVTQTNGYQCASFQYLQRNYAFDVFNPINVDYTNSSAAVQYISFWLRGSTLQLPNSATLLQMKIGLMSVQAVYNAAGSNIAFSFGGASYQTANIWDGLSHRVNIEYYSSNNLYIYTIDTSTPTSTNGLSYGQTAGTYFNAPNPHIFMAKWYSQGLTMDSSTITAEINCLVPSQLASTQFTAPVGLCKIAAGDPVNYAYCRHSLSCAGHCENYASFDSTTNTFSPLVNQCDPTYSTPDCLSRCSRTDAATGQCVDVIVQQSNGLNPQSTMCQILANYKIAVNPSQQTIQLIPRVWMYTASITVPSGQVTQIVNTGGCPQVSFTGNVDGTYTVNLVNSGNLPSYVVITYAPDGVFNGTQPCVAGCCLLSTDQVVQIPGNSQNAVTIPGDRCGLMTVIVSLQTFVQDQFSNTTAPQLSTCASVNSLQVAQQIAITAQQPVSTAVRKALSIITDDSNQNLKQVVQSVLASTVQLFALATQVGINNNTFITALNAQQNAIQNLKYNPPNVTLNTNPFDISKILNDTSTIQQQISDATLVALNQLNANAGTLNNLQNQYDIQANYTLATLAILALNLDQFRQDIANLQNIDSGSASGLSDLISGFLVPVINGVIDVGAEAVMATAHVGETFVDQGLNLLKLPLNGIGNFIGGVVKTAVDVAVIAVIIYAAIKLGPLLFSGVSKSAATFARPKATSIPSSELKSIRTKSTGDENFNNGAYSAAGATSGNVLSRSYARGAMRLLKNKQYQPIHAHDSD